MKKAKKRGKQSVNSTKKKSTSNAADLSNDFSIVQFGLGIAFCLFAAGLMYVNVMPLSMRITIGIIGILLIATSPFGPMRYAK